MEGNAWICVYIQQFNFDFIGGEITIAGQLSTIPNSHHKTRMGMKWSFIIHLFLIKNHTSLTESI